MNSLFDRDLEVVNLGLTSFKDTLERLGVPCVQVDWKPPLRVPAGTWPIIDAHRERIEAANQEALRRILAGRPALVGLSRAIDVVPGMHKDLILHAGPPITWERMCGPMRGAVMGALIYEGRAADAVEAEKLASGGTIKYAPCHEHGCTGPMAGIVSPSMPVFIIENLTYGNRTYATLNEGLGKVLRYGAFGDDVVTRLRWMETVLYPTLQRAVARLGQVDLQSLIAQALHMGDEVHNRNRAGTSLLFRQLAPAIVRTCDDPEAAAASLEFINGNDHFFLNLSMPASKACLDAARGIEASSVAVVMARNGTDFGVQLAGTDGAWFTGPALVPDALYFPGFTKADANPDIGDSAITETGGLGGFAIAAAPAIVQFVGGHAADALDYTMQMYEITAGEHTTYQIPSLDFRGTPIGIDVRKVVEKGILPFIDTGVAHREPGIGQVGAGVVNAPPEPFQNALVGLAKSLSEPNQTSGGSTR